MTLPRTRPHWLILAALSTTLLALGLVQPARASDPVRSRGGKSRAGSEGLVFRPASLDFGKVAVGERNVQTVTITNWGNSDITLLQVAVQAGDFSLSGLNLPLTLARGESFTFRVVFAPRSPGDSGGSILFRTEVSDVSTPIAGSQMTGTGIGAEGLAARTRRPGLREHSGTATEPQIGLGAIPVQHRVELLWKASTSDDVIGYNVYRGDHSGGPYWKINPVLDPSTLYVDTTAPGGHTYYYVTTAVSSNRKESVYSNQAKATIP
jgi:transmembrane protein TMEM131